MSEASLHISNRIYDVEMRNKFIILYIENKEITLQCFSQLIQMFIKLIGYGKKLNGTLKMLV